jgi:hypothetical protein
LVGFGTEEVFPNPNLNLNRAKLIYSRIGAVGAVPILKN